MKRLFAVLFASAVMMPALSYAQSNAPGTSTDVQEVIHSNTRVDRAPHADKAYGSSSSGNMQSGWITQPTAQALGQSLYIHH
ncbi:hypothetical protein AWB71_02102 [Caballeronia peredens]|nr:hypothetical protein AWB71_02102 [Caballeronia peredens]